MERVTPKLTRRILGVYLTAAPSLRSEFLATDRGVIWQGLAPDVEMVP